MVFLVVNDMSTSDFRRDIQVHVVQLVASWNSKTPVKPEQHSQGDATATKKNAERRGAGSTISSITTAPWDLIEL